MPIRFSTEAANADVMGDDAETRDTPEAMPKPVGADGTPRQRFSRSSQRDRSPPESLAEEVKPGKDINAPGFIKDKDSSKP